jgi:hypothetical protein
MSVAASQTDSVRDLSVAPSMANSSVAAISVAPSMAESVAGISVAASVADSSAPMDTEADQEVHEDTAKAMEEDIDEYLQQVSEHTTHLVAIIDQSRDWTGKLHVHPPVLNPPPYIKPLTPAMLMGALPNEDHLGFGRYLLYAQHRAWRITWEEMQLGPNKRSDDGVHCQMNGCKYSHVIPVPNCSRAKCWKHVHAGCGCAAPWYNLGDDTNIFCDAGCRLLALRQGEFERMETTPIPNPATAAVARMSLIPPEFMNKLVTTYCHRFPNFKSHAQPAHTLFRRMRHRIHCELLPFASALDDWWLIPPQALLSCLPTPKDLIPDNPGKQNTSTTEPPPSDPQAEATGSGEGEL